MSKTEDRLALVTGASRGIGYHSALTLARAGMHVIAVARTVGGLEELDDDIRNAGGSATLVPMDLLDFDAIDRLGASIHERWGKLDVLVSNAAMLGGLSPLEHIEPNTFEKTVSLNVTANWRLLCSMSPLLRASPAARVIFMTASAAHERNPFWGAYSSSQVALQALVHTWAAECEKTPIKINMLDPGPMRTAMRAQAFPGEDPDSVSHPSEISSSILLLSEIELTESGKIFSHEKGQFQE